MENIFIRTKDGYPISIHVFSPSVSNNKILVINSATGVKQQLYFGFSKYFSDFGYTVITYDYRGIGLSKPKSVKNFSASMTNWGAEDFLAVSDYVNTKFPNFQKYCLGHSVGALILGMNPLTKIYEKFIFVATQKAYLGNLTWQIKWSAIVGFGMVQPILSFFFKFFPAQYLGLGESLPSGCAFDWRTLIMNKHSTNVLLERTVNIAKDLSQPTLFLSAEDDGWVTKKGMELLIEESYPNLQVYDKTLLVTQSPKRNIGHVNFFRSYNQPLWDIPLAWLEN